MDGWPSTIADVDAFQSLEPICVVPPDANQDPQPNLTNHAEEPNPVSPSAQPDGGAEPELEPDREPDMFDNEEEYVGVDDEAMYMPVPPQYTNNVQASNHIPPEPFVNVVAIDDETEVDDADPQEVHVIYDPQNPNIVKGARFPDIISFRKAIRHYAVKKGFEFANLQTDPSRFIAKCKAEGCPWRIHASRIFDGKTIEIKRLPFEHECPTTKFQETKMANQGWCADNLTDWLKKNPTKGATDCKEKLEGDFGIQLKYSKAWSGMQVALDQIHGKYDESFQLLFNWAAQIEQVSPESLVEIEVEKIGEKHRFKRMFVALAPCIQGFLDGCRPFIGVDASCLNGKYKGQLASAVGVDGHNWLYHIAYGIFESETEDNWRWFLDQLKRKIGDVPNLVICSDACKGLETAVGVVFPLAENRECMRHLYQNFMKKYSGDVFTDHLYPAARSYTKWLFQWHMKRIADFEPKAIEYLENHHNRIWYRCSFGENSKCDYLTNNVSESFNAQIKKFKGLLLHELVDRIRELIMEKRYARKMIARQWADGILPNVIKELNLISNNLKVVKIVVSDVDMAEVTILDDWNNQKRETVDLKNHSCGCRQWQVIGKPCKHALAWILSNRGLRIADYVHEYYSVARFKAAYEQRIEPIPDRSQWPVVELPFKVHQPLLGRSAGRPKVQRQRGCLEKRASKKKVKCKRCGNFGHFGKTCKLAEVGKDGERAPARGKANKRDQTNEAGASQTNEAGASQAKKLKKCTSKKKKKTPVKKRLMKAAANPPVTVVSSLRRLVYED
ncbi:Unknown protein [Striga hermonthica]|uniref:Uncharacterized protein n=1 Tax=Striga hermonthica TaxID=68872 RepID=A0A9N7MRV5_STRHE|nr:Unknown protein [Striga hermonthica]